MGDVMKGYTLDDKDNHNLSMEYGLNYYDNKDPYVDYKRFYSTKNNLNCHENIKKR